MKYKLVTDGEKWAVYRWSLFWMGKRFYDLKDPGYEWSRDSMCFKHCWSDLETAEMWHKRLNSC